MERIAKTIRDPHPGLQAIPKLKNNRSCKESGGPVNGYSFKRGSPPGTYAHTYVFTYSL